MSDYFKNYWLESLGQAADECDLVMTSEQLEFMAQACMHSHEMYSEYSGDNVASANFSAQAEQEKQKLIDELEKERNKTICRDCYGEGRIINQGPYHSSNSECWTCKGVGKI